MCKPVCIVIVAMAMIASVSAQPQFVDISEHVGNLTSVDDGISGTAWGDFNRDGWQDLYLASFGVNLLFENKQDETFEEVAATFGVDDASESKAATWGDIDNDAYLDLYVSNDTGVPNKLFQNMDGMSFVEISASAGVNDTFFSQGGAWADFDGDGDLDYYLLQDDVGNRFFRNHGDLTFTDVAPDLGMDNVWAAYGICWLDYDSDHDLDLFVANCQSRFGSNWTNLLYRNNGDGSFTEVSGETNLDYFGASWGAKALDFNNDRAMDLVVVNSDDKESFLLYRNDGGVFTEISEDAGLPNVGVLFAVTAGDYDNDGDIDLIAAGFEPAKVLLENKGDGTFRNISERIEFPDLAAPRYESLSTADFDNDGFLDFVIADSRGRAYVFHNQPSDSISQNTWLIVKLRGIQSNSFGIGASVTTVAEDLKQIRYVEAGSGLYAQDMIPVHFGFGKRSTIDTLIVRWPSGIMDTLRDVGSNQILQVEEGSTVTGVRDLQSSISPNDFHLGQNYPNPFNPVTTIPYSVRVAAKVTITIYDVRGKQLAVLADGFHQPGRYEVVFDGDDLASGVYLYRAEVAGASKVKKLLLLK